MKNRDMKGRATVGEGEMGRNEERKGKRKRRRETSTEESGEKRKR